MIQIETNKLRAMINKAVRLCSDDDVAPIKNFMEITASEGYLVIKTTDVKTQIVLREKIEGNESMRAVIDALKINALINKTTSPTVSLNITDNLLQFIGNGVYQFNLRIDDNGEIMKFPLSNYDENEEVKEIALGEIIKRINACKKTIPETQDSPELLNYYLHDRVVGTNAYKVTTILNHPSAAEFELIIPNTFGNFLSTLDYEKCNFYVKDNNLFFIGLNEEFFISTSMSADLEQFKVSLSGINNMMTEQYASKVSINRNHILEAIDRILLFNDEYLGTNASFYFTETGIKVRNKNSSGVEEISYQSLKDVKMNFSCTLNINYLRDQMNSLLSDEIVIYFGGNGAVIKFEDTIITQFLALVEDDEL